MRQQEFQIERLTSINIGLMNSRSKTNYFSNLLKLKDMHTQLFLAVLLLSISDAVFIMKMLLTGSTEFASKLRTSMLFIYAQPFSI
jgi:hypothetical protein